jgi:molybdopterin-guanine dinucleotide biosynthesis protein A
MSGRPDISQLDAIVLAGGDSRRMGSPKAILPFGSTTLVGAAVEALRPVFRQVLVITRDKAPLSGLDVEILEDDRPLQGPLVGLARGLSHSGAPWCFLAACDMPFLQTKVIQKMAAHLRGCDAVVPEYNGRLQTLHAFYSNSCLSFAEELLGQGITSMKALLPRCRVTRLTEDHFASVPGGLQSFRDLDTDEEYRAALNAHDFPPAQSA